MCNMLNNSLKYKQSGLSIVELLMACAVIAVIVVGGYRNMQSTQMESKILTLEKNVNSLMEAMRGYWYINCQNEATKTITSPYTELVNNKLIPSTVQVINPLGTNTLTVQYGTSTYSGNSVAYVQARAKVDLVPTDMGADIANRLKGTWYPTSKYIYWTRMVAMDDSGSSLWILNSDLEKFRRYENPTGCKLAN